jgi:hypothetical protein
MLNAVGDNLNNTLFQGYAGLELFFALLDANAIL